MRAVEGEADNGKQLEGDRRSAGDWEQSEEIMTVR
jgi:hypothetical protein